MAIAIAERCLLPHQIRPHALEGLIGGDGQIDWSPWYLTEEEDMGQSGEQCDIITVLASSLRVLAKRQGWKSGWVGYDCFFAWVEGEYNVQVSPDVFMVENPPRVGERMPKRWETWRPDMSPPLFAVEIVSDDWKKDYRINPARYDHLGVTELVLVDPDAFADDLSAKGRAPFTVYHRSPRDRLELSYCGHGPAWCAEIAAYLCFQKTPLGRLEARISLDATGSAIVPTFDEVAGAQAEELLALDKELDAQAEKIAAQAEKIDTQAKELAKLRARLQKLEGSET